MNNGMFGQIVPRKNLIGQIATGVTAFFLASIALPATDVNASDAVLIDFSSTHCGPCRTMSPIINQLERQGVPVRHVNVDAEPNLAIRYGIRQTPTYVIVTSGKEVTRLVGSQSYDELRRALAINPSGPLIPTGTDVAHRGNDHPRTRLAPSNERQISLAAAPRRSNISEPMPSISLASAIERARAATVRLKVHDTRGYGAGTGTIIDTHGEHALVLTCGHLFRDTQGKGKIEVDLFVGGQTRTVLGRVIDYDAGDRDIALLEIQPGFAVQPVPLLKKGQTLRTGQVAFSFGCDRGDDPSRHDTRLTGVDSYNAFLGSQTTIKISGAPIDGRSGGGLFDDQGRLIGVCNAADYKGDEGYYTGPGSIQWQLDRVPGLSRLYEPDNSFVNNTQPTARPPANGSPPLERIASLPSTHIPGAVVQASATAPISQRNENNGVSNREVIVIVRDPSSPDQPRVMTLHQPTADLMQMIERQAR